MRALLLLPLLLTAVPVCADEIHGWSADGKMDDNQYMYKASEADILRTPIWKPNADFPPLSARKAQEIARREMQALLGNGKEQWVLRETTIADMGDGMHFVYIIQFEPPLGQQSCVGCDFIRILVLMDGTVPKPVIRPIRS
jgi:hypothetical protein